MICFDCKVKEVCSVLTAIHDLSDIVDLELHSCRILDRLNNLEIKKQSVNVIKRQSITKGTNGEVRDLKDFLNSKTDITEECPNCHSIVNKEDLIKCTCGTIICKNCGIALADKNKYLCEVCWNK